MLYWAAFFFVIAVVAAFVGYGGVSSAATSVAKILFIVALVLGAISLLFGFGRRRAAT
jgi:uncharacterized membrane protein YtjA (UPF0391 family)